VEIAGDHFGFRDTADGPGGREGGIVDVARAIIAWLAPRFAAAVARP